MNANIIRAVAIITMSRMVAHLPAEDMADILMGRDPLDVSDVAGLLPDAMEEVLDRPMWWPADVTSGACTQEQYDEDAKLVAAVLQQIRTAPLAVFDALKEVAELQMLARIAVVRTQVEKARTQTLAQYLSSATPWADYLDEDISALPASTVVARDCARLTRRADALLEFVTDHGNCEDIRLAIARECAKLHFG